MSIQIKGHIDAEWSGWLEGLTATHTAEGDTVLSGVIPDQPALYGLLNRLSELGMQLISVTPGRSDETE